MNVTNELNLNKEKKLFFIKENIYVAVLIFLIFFLDRISKKIIINNLNENPIFVNDYINLELIWNIGIGFGLLSTNSYFIYNIISAIIGIVILILLYFTIFSKKLDKLVFSIIIGGALGNFYDRLIYNAVPDFVDLHYNSFHWFAFNVADIFITLGIIIFLIKDFCIKKNN